MVRQAREFGYECVGLLMGNCEPSGTIADAAFEAMAGEFIDRLR
jgi:microcystin degradation protein MlrC